MKIFKTLLVLLTAAASAHAAIVVTGTDFFVDANDHIADADDRTISGFTVAAGEKLVVTTTSENADISGITFNGISLTQVYNTVNSIQRVATYYLDVASTTTANIVADVDGNMHFGFAAYAISGAAAGGPADFSSSASRLAGDVETESGSLIIGSFTKNAFDSITLNTAAANVYKVNSIGAGGTSGMAAYYFSTTVSTDDFGFNNSNARPAAGAVVFNVIPEPSSIALLGLAGVALVLVSRRRD
ncbi:PEP-CTERM sorting domain-containing protein [Kiritimatiellaeota bacterium B1221]|nr:PEP-CTERM sorting domain-containing protein [Kiritimatiellaeota bacterium B1221]